MKKHYFAGIVLVLIFVAGCLNIPTETAKQEIVEEDTPNINQEIVKEDTPPISQEVVKETIYSINQDITVDYLTYKVLKVETFTEMGISMFNKETEGKFIKVYLKIMNDAKETKQIFTPRFWIEDNQGRKYDRLDDDMMYIADYLELGKQLQPGLAASGAVVFEMPRDSENLKLVIEGDWLSTTKIKVALSNIEDIGKDITLKEEQDRIWDEAMAEGETQMDELMSKCNAPFKCSSSCSEYLDAGQKDCPAGQLCCME